ncbi:MAG: response regulator [Spirochaeta sp.]
MHHSISKPAFPSAEIILVEDEHVVALDLQRMLRGLGYTVNHLYSSGEAIIADLAEGRKTPDLILMDIHLAGELSGIETASHIARIHSIPVIMLTAFTDPKTVDKALAVSPYGYIVKPFDMRELKTSITIALLRHRMETEVIRSRSRLFAAVQCLPDGIMITDAEDIIVEVNEGLLHLFGTNRDKIIGCSVTKIIEQYELDLSGSPCCIRTYEEKWVKVFQGQLDDTASGRIISCQDITARVRAEKQLEAAQQRMRHTAKMEALGRMSEGIAHDFNNMLTVVSGHISVLQQHIDELNTRDSGQNDGDMLISNGIQGIQAAARKSGEIIRQLLAFSRNQAMQFESLYIDQFLTEKHESLQSLLIDDYDIELSLNNGAHRILIDPGSLNHAIINLVLNARDALPGSGRILLQTECIHLEEVLNTQIDSIPAGTYTVLSVLDQGSGISFETVEQIFEPFYTTKTGSGGFGLGLSIVYGIVKQSNGYVQVHPNHPKGTIFRLYFPVHTPDSHQP